MRPEAKTASVWQKPAAPTRSRMSFWVGIGMGMFERV